MRISSQHGEFHEIGMTIVVYDQEEIFVVRNEKKKGIRSRMKIQENRFPKNGIPRGLRLEGSGGN